MIQKGSFLRVVDNSGAKRVCCIGVGKGFRKRYAFLGEIVLVSIKSLRNRRRSFSKVLKGNVVYALIVRCKSNTKNFHKNEGFLFLENAVVLLSKKNKFIATIIFGGVPLMIRYTKYLRVIALSSGCLL